MGLMIAGWILLIAGLAFGLLLGILFASSFLGWRRFASRYRTSAPVDRDLPRLHFVTGSFAWWAAYNRCLTAVPSLHGIFVRPIPPFVFFHPWLFLPWSELESREEHSCFGLQRMKLRFRGPGRSSFRLFLPMNARKLLPLWEITN